MGSVSTVILPNSTVLAPTLIERTKRRKVVGDNNGRARRSSICYLPLYSCAWDARADVWIILAKNG